MPARNTTSPLLILLVLVLTFPLWIALGAAGIGLLAGIIAAVAGVFAALIAAVIAIVALPFKLLGWGHWGWHDWGWGHHKLGTIVVLVIITALIVRSRKKIS